MLIAMLLDIIFKDYIIDFEEKWALNFLVTACIFFSQMVCFWNRSEWMSKI
jgi:hypothetical protein